ncbi:MAG: hypothetical protein KA746_07610 [Pyrinomonadaceae bacterium]|nr:hypothetical protein [Pyrinomonadaceae bacterium]MBP6213879.1 hypothetical protein [Pyrinomonadaceae bacterium]
MSERTIPVASATVEHCLTRLQPSLNAAMENHHDIPWVITHGYNRTAANAAF